MSIDRLPSHQLPTAANSRPVKDESGEEEEHSVSTPSILEAEDNELGRANFGVLSDIMNGIKGKVAEHGASNAIEALSKASSHIEEQSSDEATVSHNGEESDETEDNRGPGRGKGRGRGRHGRGDGFMPPGLRRHRENGTGPFANGAKGIMNNPFVAAAIEADEVEETEAAQQAQIEAAEVEEAKKAQEEQDIQGQQSIDSDILAQIAQVLADHDIQLDAGMFNAVTETIETEIGTISINVDDQDGEVAVEVIDVSTETDEVKVADEAVDFEIEEIPYNDEVIVADEAVDFEIEETPVNDEVEEIPISDAFDLPADVDINDPESFSSFIDDYIQDNLENLDIQSFLNEVLADDVTDEQIAV